MDQEVVYKIIGSLESRLPDIKSKIAAQEPQVVTKKVTLLRKR